MNDELIDRAVHAAMGVNRRHRQLIEECVRKIGFHRTAHMTLMQLAKADKIPSQKELAERFSITPAAVTGILKGLERDGYITRASGRDGRVNEIFITPLGRDVVERSRRVFMDVDKAMFEGFSEEELECYIRLTSRMEENMKHKKEDCV